MGAEPSHEVSGGYTMRFSIFRTNYAILSFAESLCVLPTPQLMRNVLPAVAYSSHLRKS